MSLQALDWLGDSFEERATRHTPVIPCQLHTAAMGPRGGRAAGTFGIQTPCHTEEVVRFSEEPLALQREATACSKLSTVSVHGGVGDTATR